MTAKSCIKRTPTTPNLGGSNLRQNVSGFTLIELLVAMALFLVVITIAFNAFSSSNKLVEADTNRVMAGQNVQGALDLLAADVRQAGENLELDLGISGITFDNGAQTMTVRRSIPADVVTGVKVQRLPLCYASGTTFQVSGPPPSLTTPANASCASGPSEVNVGPWRDYFTAQNGQVQAALLYRPKSGSTPSLIVRTTVSAVQNTTGTGNTRRTNLTLGSVLPGGFTATNGTQILLIDERRYFLDTASNELRLALGGQADDEAQAVAYAVTGLALSATLVNPDATVTSMGLTGPWRRIKQVSLNLTANNAGQGRGGARSFQATVFPRNVETARSAGTGAP